MRSSACRSAARGRAGSSRRSSTARPKVSKRGRSSRWSARSRRRSSSSRSGSPTTTARRRRARSRSSRPRRRSDGRSRRLPAERQALGGESAPSELAPEQSAAVARIVAAPPGTNLLLYGATGSGKTEVYLQACASMLERGFGAIILVPEIALAPQTVGRVRARFGDRVAILHSALTDAERRDERARIASGEARIVVGARSAVFAPIRGLGLIVVDEEHDASYKQDSDPRYDARTVAAKRAALEGAVAVYGSATPRPESWASLERLRARRADRCRSAAGARHRSAPRGRLSALGAAARRAATRRREPRQGDPAAQPARDRAGAPLPRVRHDDPLPELRRRPGAARRLVAAVPPLRLRARRAVELPGVRLARSGAHRRRDAEARARARARAAGSRADPPRRRRCREARAARGAAAAVRRRRGRGPARDADGREGPSLRRCRARGRRRRRHGARAAGLPRRGTHVPADHPARRAQRPRRPGPRPRPDVPARRAADRPRRAARRRRAS